MKLLEDLFDQTMKTFRLEKEQLKTKSEFNFDTYDQRGFESVRGVFRFSNAAAEKGFTDFAFVAGEGLADLEAKKDGERWFIEVKTLVVQLKERTINVGSGTEVLVVDKFQPDSNKISDYVEIVSRQIAANLVGKARNQLSNTVKQKGEAKKMIALVINLFGADFLGVENLKAIHARLGGRLEGWELDYLEGVDALAFLTSTLYIFT
jgi:hypothetical protein